MAKVIRCPRCGENFEIDEAGYAAIVQQVHDAEFQKEISERRKICAYGENKKRNYNRCKPLY